MPISIDMQFPSNIPASSPVSVRPELANTSAPAAVSGMVPGSVSQPAPTVSGTNDPEIRAAKRIGRIECQTCKDRQYQDGSNDPGVSFKTPGHIDPQVAASVVMSHEQEHVRNETAKASGENRKVVSQTVTLQTSVCPECGRVYVSGGKTRTVTKGDDSREKKDFFVENFKNLMDSSFGKKIDTKV